MALYLVGAVLLELNLLSFTAHHLLAHPDNPSPGVILYAVLLSWFICDYLVFERIHLYTYDLFADWALSRGFWGVSRHVNYLGEILMAGGLTLSLGRPSEFGPWPYPIYYVVILSLRERDDDRRCAAKYGALRLRYRERVPWRIVPRVY
ncbi:hypothetical protein [Candidatus Palauibacter sp.]|uniref:hypothetical protein n=1 Tax=Candidatus Palauibacter sp. TaxID=3101350 RepID=UPI003B592E40